MGSSKMESGNIMSSERDTLPAAASKVAGRARRRMAWGLVLAAGLAAAPAVGWAQGYRNTGPLVVDEGTLSAEGVLTPATVTLGLQARGGPAVGTITYTWEQITAASFGSDRTGTTYTHEVASTDPSPCAGGVLSSSDPNYVALSGTTTGSITFSDALVGRSFGSPTFTAPDVVGTTSLYFRVGFRRTISGTPSDICRTYRVDINDVHPPTVDLGADRTVAEGDTVILAATASGRDPITTWLLLTQTTGPTPSYSWSIASHTTTFTAP